MGAPLFSQQSLLYLRLPPPPCDRLPPSGTLPKTFEPEFHTTWSLVRSSEGYSWLAALSCFPGQVQGELKLELLQWRLQPPGPGGGGAGVPAL